MGYWDNRERMAKKAREHTAEMDSMYEAQIRDCVERTKIYSPDFQLDRSIEVPEVKAEVVAADSVEAIMKYTDGKTAVLNFASYKNPGGRFYDGSTAQEESLCHESFLYNVLREMKPYYEWNLQHRNKALYCNRGLFTPDVIFEREGQRKGVSVITVAAPNKYAAQKYQQIPDSDNTYALMNRIKFVLDIAADNEIETLILGAYGCGVFGQDPVEVSNIFRIALKFYDFKKVIFAIPYGPNFEAFKKAFYSSKTSILHF